MNIRKFYTSTASVERETFVSGSTVRKDFTTHLAAVSCNVQAMTGELAQQFPGAFGKMFQMFCDIVDIKEGDRVVISGVKYNVESVEKFEMGMNPHLRVNIITAKL